jgi:hypothetical protein
MRINQAFFIFALCFFSIHAQSQLIPAPEPQTATVIGVVADTDNVVIPGATVSIDGPTSNDASRKFQMGMDFLY